MAQIAVVIPALNEEANIEGAIQSAHTATEIVVADGGSTDRTREIAKRAGAKVVLSPKGRGIQLNRGAAATTAPILLFLHADCRLPEGWHQKLASTLCNPGVALTAFRLHTESIKPKTGKLYRFWIRLLDLRSMGLGLPYGDQAYGVRREVFEKLGGFKEIPLMEDYDFALRCRKLGKIVILPLSVRTTARRFERAPVRSRIATLLFPTLFRLGVSPWTLAKWYRDIR